MNQIKKMLEIDVKIEAVSKVVLKTLDYKLGLNFQGKNASRALEKCRIWEFEVVIDNFALKK